MEVRFTILLLLNTLLSFCIAELDIQVIILDDKQYNATKFEKAIAEFDPIIIENGTVRKLLPNPPKVQAVGFANPVLCVDDNCFTEAVQTAPPTSSVSSTSISSHHTTSTPMTSTPVPSTHPQTTSPPTTPIPVTPMPVTPSPTGNQNDVIVISAVVGSVVLLFVGMVLYNLPGRKTVKTSRIVSRSNYYSNRVVIRETIEWPVHSATSLLC
jgi:hypothetical protein